METVGAGDELVTIVDEENNVLAEIRRYQMRAGWLPHRGSYILVFNSKGELYVHKRSLAKDVFPGYYDVVAGGVVLAGETYEESAVRELSEELGISRVPLKRLFDFYYEDEHIRVWGTAFSCLYDGEIVLQKEEIDEGTFMEMDHLLGLVQSERFTPDGLYVLRRYLREVPLAAAGPGRLQHRDSEDHCRRTAGRRPIHAAKKDHSTEG
ncbi:MAG: NUDIX hydrolase YfcD [Syntrophobacteria bacterium]